MTKRATGRRSMAACVAMLACVLLGSVSLQARAGHQTPQPAPRFTVGEVFPVVALPALEDGRPRSLADFRGQKLILHIFASW